MTLEYFFARKQRASGVSSWCKECHKEYMKLYREKNREKLLKQAREHTIKNRENHKRYMKKSNEIFYKENGFSYGPRHRWVAKHKQKPKICCICNERRKLELANISGEYKKDIKDFLWVCRKCHILFDKCNKTHTR